MSDDQTLALPILRAFQGTEPPEEVLRAIRDGEAAGVALYRALNVSSPAQLRSLGLTVQRAALEGGQPTAIVAIDQEGGQLMAVGPPATQFAGNMALGATGDEDLARRVGVAMGRELAAMGCNVSWAPDLDLATLPASPAVGARAFGDDPQLAAVLGAAMIDGLQETGVAAAAKHFPGSGETTGDPHHGLPVVDLPAATLEERELVPFRAAIDAGVRMIMVSHAAFPGLEPADAGARPALRSPAVLRDLLRDRMGFEGVVVTDALDMGAVDQRDVARAAVDAVRAGVDLLLTGPGQADRPEELRAMVRALRRAPEAVAAMERVHALRRWLDRGTTPPLSVVGCAEHARLAAELARGALTGVRDLAGILPLRPSGSARFLVLTATPTDLTPADTSATVRLGLFEAVRHRHTRTSSFMVSFDPDANEIAAACAAVVDSDLVILGTIDAFRSDGQQELVRQILELGRPVVMVALRMPCDADLLDDVPTALACYSIHRASTDAAIAAIFGEIEPPGEMPLSVATRAAYRPASVLPAGWEGNWG